MTCWCASSHQVSCICCCSRCRHTAHPAAAAAAWPVACLQDVALKLLLDAARGLAYMHDVDVVHGDVKSRNLLVFYEDEDDDADENTVGADEAAQENGNAAAANSSKKQQQQGEGEREVVWALKWCDFGVSFRAAEAPDGILRTVSRVCGQRLCSACLLRFTLCVLMWLHRLPRAALSDGCRIST